MLYSVLRLLGNSNITYKENNHHLVLLDIRWHIAFSIAPNCDIEQLLGVKSD